MSDVAEQQGWAVAHAAVEEAVRVLGGRLASAYAIGSLAHGGFAPAASDVDVALLTDGGGAIAEEADEIAAATRARVDSPLAERLSVFHAPWPLHVGPGPGSRFPAIDRLDLVEHGVLMHGEERRDEASWPAPEDVVDEAVRFSLERLELVPGQAVPLVAPDAVRKPAKLVLAPVRLLFLADTAQVASNDAAVEHYRHRAGSAHGALVDAALTWRTAGVIDDLDRARSLLVAHLLALHVEVLSELAARGGIPHAEALGRLAVRYATAQVTHGVR
ncbi:MAG TPA: hypothetical protein VGM33_15090 [Baekduia sp.]|jgi:predicted nucleotidyltransferase